MNDPPQLAAVFDHFDVQYRERQGNQAILCFSHDESRPSCTVDLAKGVFNCKACDAQGGVYDAIIILAKLGSRREAAEFAAENGLGEGDDSSRSKHRERPRVPRGKGFAPRYRNSLPSWRRGSE